MILKHENLTFTNRHLQDNKLIMRCNIRSIFDAAIDGLITLNIVAGNDARYIHNTQRVRKLQNSKVKIFIK